MEFENDMEIENEIVDINTLNKYLSEKKLKRQKHPSLDLYIWNYAESIQYSKKWDSVLYKCRGLVTDSQGNVVAKSFDKFFNYGEVENGYTNFIGDIYKDEYTIYEKYDGSLGLLFYYQNEWIFCTKGSFTSEQALHGQELLKNKYSMSLQILDTDLCYLFEIIYPENRIVVNYNQLDDLVYLTSFYKNGNEKTCTDFMENLGFPVARPLENNSIEYLLNINESNKEGFVLYYPKNKSRLKIKFDEYLKYHKIIGNLTIDKIFEQLKNDTPLDKIIEMIPDEYYNWLHNVVDNINLECNVILNKCKEIYQYNYDSDKKVFAKNISNLEYSPILFKLYNNKVDKASIYKILKNSQWYTDFKSKNELSEYNRDTFKNSRYNNIINSLKNSDDPIPLNSSKPDCIIFDIDGTLCLLNDRNPFDLKRIQYDSPNPPVILMNDLVYKAGIHVILCTGRSEECKVDTERWLKEYNVKYNDIYFRPYKNYSPDYKIKELFWRHVAQDFNIVTLFDDRNQVVDHARKLGLSVFQVNYGDF